MSTTEEKLVSIIYIVENAAIDISDYDDESETLAYHTAELYAAVTMLKYILKTQRDTLEQ